MEKTIGIVVLDFNQRKITLRCLLSLVQGNRTPDIVVLVENGDAPFYDWRVEKLINLKIVILRPGQNLGCAGGRNLGLNYLIENTNVTTLIILDNDTVVPCDFIERIAQISLLPLEVVTPVIFDIQTNEVWSCGGTIERDGSIQQHTSQLKGIYQDIQTVDWGPGACLIMNRQTWGIVGQFDKWMNFLFEDIEWCFRVKKLGGRLIMHNGLHLHHEANQSLGGQWSQARVRLWARNGTLFRLAIIRPGIKASLKWLANETTLAFRDFFLGRISWSIARLIGLFEGLRESVRRRTMVS